MVHALFIVTFAMVPSSSQLVAIKSFAVTYDVQTRFDRAGWQI